MQLSYLPLEAQMLIEAKHKTKLSILCARGKSSENPLTACTYDCKIGQFNCDFCYAMGKLFLIIATLYIDLLSTTLLQNLRKQRVERKYIWKQQQIACSGQGLIQRPHEISQGFLKQATDCMLTFLRWCHQYTSLPWPSASTWYNAFWHKSYLKEHLYPGNAIVNMFCVVW